MTLSLDPYRTMARTSPRCARLARCMTHPPSTERSNSPTPPLAAPANIALPSTHKLVTSPARPSIAISFSANSMSAFQTVMIPRESPVSIESLKYDMHQTQISSFLEDNCAVSRIFPLGTSTFLIPPSESPENKNRESSDHSKAVTLVAPLKSLRRLKFPNSSTSTNLVDPSSHPTAIVCLSGDRASDHIAPPCESRLFTLTRRLYS
mmetsp:Transcript_11011/g.45849  ORF Transcript_11011/g.45849 Transcript_11011/m.45849 type:complete len:207 (-) Transcript_11011:427-1047(-)